MNDLAADLKLWLCEAALPLWWTKGGDHERGGFHEALDMRGDPVNANRRARVASSNARRLRL